MELIVVGCNFQTASIARREAWALNSEKKFSNAVFLATCNRVEIYAAVREGTSSERLLQRWGISEKPGYVRRGEAAFAHLVRVASGLDSMVLGETEVMGQVKRAYQKALESGATNPLLNFAFQRAFAIAKKIRTETGIGRLPVSVASVGLMLLEQIFGSFKKVRAAVAGLGPMGKQAALGLVKRGIGRLTLLSRNIERAEDFASGLSLSAEVLPLEALESLLSRVDLLVTAAGRPGYLISVHPRASRETLQVFLDLGVPRNIDPLLGQSGNLFLYNVDDLKEIAEKNLADRREAAQAAEQILSQELLTFEREWGKKTNFGRVAQLVRVLP